MKPDEKAEAATRLLNEPVMKQVFVDIRDGLVRQLESVPISDTQSQHEITLMLQLLKRFQSQLAKYIGDHALEKHRAKSDEFVKRKKAEASRGV